MIFVSVIVTTYNEEKNLPRCLSALKMFDEIIVVDSKSKDRTCDIAIEYGAQVVSFDWNGQYPKKRQWCLDNLRLKHDRIFFVDADELITPDLIEEIKNLTWLCAGYFVKAKYVWKNKTLSYGLKNNKLVLFDRKKIEFPIVDDLDIEGMGEMEGHYQPVLKKTHQSECLGQLKSTMFHYAYDDEVSWNKRHERYARWEAKMIKCDAYPKDPSVWRNFIKQIFRIVPLRGLIAFLHSYIVKLGFLDGKAGFSFAKTRALYYKMVSKNFHELSSKVAR